MTNLKQRQRRVPDLLERIDKREAEIAQLKGMSAYKNRVRAESAEARIAVLEEQERTAGEGMSVLAGEIGAARARVAVLEKALRHIADKANEDWIVALARAALALQEEPTEITPEHIRMSGHRHVDDFSQPHHHSAAGIPIVTHTHAAEPTGEPCGTCHGTGKGVGFFASKPCPCTERPVSD